MQDIATKNTPDWLKDLNEQQKKAVVNVDGACLILAGAGTGKTRVLTSRLAQIIYQQKASPFEIICVTFTNKAAKEMRERVELYTGNFPSSWIGTFHSICLKMLRKNSNIVNLKSDFIVIDEDDQLRVLKEIMVVLDIDKDRFPAKQILKKIQSYKDDALTPDMVNEKKYCGGKMQAIYRSYQNRLQQLNCVDFGDIILLVLQILKNESDILKEYQSRFKYILVDEYQDTNIAQYQWLKLLSLKNENVNIACVGDDDQSIYGWRGARVGNILRFEKDFKDSTIIRLEQNYRSTGYILKTANGIIAQNQSRLGKNLITTKGDGEKIKINNYYDGKEEATGTCLKIEQYLEKGTPASEIAILVRAGFQTRSFEEKLINLNIPYRVIGGTRFYEREEIRDAIAYLRLIHQKTDDLAFERIINKPARGIGKATLQKLQILSRKQGESLYGVAEKIIKTDELSTKAKNSLNDILVKFSDWRYINEKENHITATKTMLEQSGYIEHWNNSKDVKSQGRIEALKELVSAMEEFENIAGFLEHIALVTATDKIDNNEMVSIMTMHASKGLEFDAVFLAGWEDGLFPSEKSMDESGIDGLEEERRLAYVGITRSKKYCHISWAKNRLVHGNWQNNIYSRFLENISPEYIDLHDNNAFTSSRLDYKWQKTDNNVEVIKKDDNDDEFKVGQRCFHQKFGMGTVASCNGQYVTVAFDKAGTKKMMSTFLESA